MKKAMAVVLAAGLIAGICAVALFARREPSFVPPRPEDTALEFWICDDVTETDWSGHEEAVGWFGAAEYLGRGYSMEGGERPPVRVSYILTAWPDHSDVGSYVTTIEITDPAVSVYGLTVDSEPEEFERVMKSMGYRVESADGGLQTAARGGFTFSLQHGDSPSLRVSAHVSNRDGVVF